MRNYKFRGKRIYDGEWVYGDLVQYESGECALFTRRLSRYGHEATELFKREQVLPESVGQFVGLLDKNKIEICEGDILKVLGVDYNETCKDFNGEVVYKYNYFCCIYKLSDGFPFRLRSSFEKTEIIGNTTDNPELLEVKNGTPR